MTKFKSIVAVPDEKFFLALTEAGDLAMIDIGKTRSMTAAHNEIPNVKVTHFSVDVENLPGDVQEFRGEPKVDRVQEGQVRQWWRGGHFRVVDVKRSFCGNKYWVISPLSGGSLREVSEIIVLQNSKVVPAPTPPVPVPPLRWWNCYKGHPNGELTGFFARVLARTEPEALNLANNDMPYSQFQKALPL